MNRILFVMWMAGMLLLSSCSIKEDRDGCPCWMMVEMLGQAGNDGERVALYLEKQQVMITVSDWDGVVVMGIVI